MTSGTGPCHSQLRWNFQDRNRRIVALFVKMWLVGGARFVTLALSASLVRIMGQLLGTMVPVG